MIRAKVGRRFHRHLTGSMLAFVLTLLISTAIAQKLQSLFEIPHSYKTLPKLMVMGGHVFVAQNLFSSAHSARSSGPGRGGQYRAILLRTGKIPTALPSCNRVAKFARMPAWPSAIIFDFDGVIVNSEPLHFGGFRKVLADEQIELTENEYYQDLIGFDDRGAFKHNLC